MPWQDHLFSPFVLECPCVITGARRPSPARRRRILPLRPALGSHPSALTRLPALTQRQNRPAGTFWTRAAFLLAPNRGKCVVAVPCTTPK